MDANRWSKNGSLPARIDKRHADGACDSIRAAMRDARAALQQDLRSAHDSASKALDWRDHVKRKPVLAIAAALAAGYLLAPTAKRILQLTDGQFAELTRRGALEVSAARAGNSRTAAQGMLVALASLAGRTAIERIGPRLEAYLHKKLTPTPPEATQPASEGGDYA